MNPEKASTLRLLREAMGKTVNVISTRGSEATHEVWAHLPDCPETSLIPVLFLITSLAFLEANPESETTVPEDYQEIDGWTPSDFLAHLRFEDGRLRVSLGRVRGRLVGTEVSLSTEGDLSMRTHGRGQSANRWLAYVRGQSHLQRV